MSGTIGSTYGVLGVLLASASASKQRVDQLTAQAASGHVADSYGGLGAPTQTVLTLQPQVTRLGVLQTNIDVATGRQGVTQTALTRLIQVAQDFYANTDTLNGLNPQNVDVTAARARDALQEVASVLDTKDGDTYVFGGTDTATAPVPNPDGILTSGFFTQIQAAVGGLSATTPAATLAIASSNAPGTTPFAGPPGTAPTIETGDGTQTQVGLLANQNTLAVSAGPSTTGSYVRDLLRGLATLGSLSSGQMGNANFAALVADTRTSLSGVVDAAGSEAGALGNVQARLTTDRARLGDTATALTKQVSDLQDVDLAKTASDLSAAQTQLQASYQLLAGMKSLSLVNYL